MFKNLLLAIDINAPESAAKSAAAAVSMAKAGGATLHLLNVVPDSGMAIVGASLGKDHMERMLAAARAELKGWAETHIPADVPHELHIAEGTVYDQIIKAADTLNIDAIVVGSHRPELKDYLIGPNAARVARHAPQSVLVVR